MIFTFIDCAFGVAGKKTLVKALKIISFLYYILHAFKNLADDPFWELVVES